MTGSDRGRGRAASGAERDPAGSGRRGREFTLPADVMELVEAVLDAADLPPTVRQGVRDELVAHFEDGLDAGHDPGELVARFGNPVEAGERIGRERRRADARRSRGRTGTGGGIMGGGMSMSEGWTELKRAVRSLLGSPGYTAVVLATLALGVGANTAVFTALDAVLLAPLPYEEPDRLVRVYERGAEGSDWDRIFLRGAAIPEYRSWTDVFEDLGVLYTYREGGADLTGGDRPVRVVVSRVDAGFFETLGVPPLLGRTLRPEESVGDPEAELQVTPVAVLSHGLWIDRFGGDPDVVGRTLRMDGDAYEVVGVMPERFEQPFGTPPDVWIPQNLTPGGYNSWGNHYLSAVARLPDGVTVEQAQARAEARISALVDEIPDAEGWTLELAPLRADLVGETRRTMLWILAGAVGLVLLSACVNAGNLVFSRSLGRRRDLAVRGALGSGRSRLVGHLLAESAVLALAGGLAGVAVGWVGVRGLLALAPEALPTVATPALSGRVFGLSLAATAGALLLFGLVPALRMSRTSPAEALRAGGRGDTEAGGLRTVRNALVVVQVSVALVLVVGAGLLVRSFAELRSVDLAVESEGVVTFEVHLPTARYPDGASRQAFHERFQSRLADIPGVEAAGATSWLPVNGRYHSWGFNRDFSALEDDSQWTGADMRFIAGDYFDAVGIDVVRGAGWEAMDPDGPPVVWISRELAEWAFPDGSPIGRRVFAANEERQVAGVVEDVPHAPDGSVAPTVYVPHAHYADNRNWALIQTVKAPELTAGALRVEAERELAAIDGQLVLYRPRPFDALLASARAQDRFATALMGSFAALALLLAVVGTYGVLAGTVARRRREIGIRMALGADAGSVRGMVLRYALGLVAAGTLVGAAGAWYGARWLRSLLFEVQVGDPTVYATAAVVLVGTSAVAAWIPARRATRVDPARTLGAE